jgi:hypothetical protein
MNALRGVVASPAMRAAVPRGVARRAGQQCVPRRFFGAAQPESQSMKAKLFEGHPEVEGWETIMNVTYAGTFILLVLNFGFTPNTSIKTVR